MIASSTEDYQEIDKRYAIITKKKDVHMLNKTYNIYKKEFKSNYTTEKMMILFDRGFVPDCDDIKFSVKNKKEIPMIETFGVTLDNEFLKLCQENTFYPKYGFKCISPEMLELQSLCASKNLPKIRAFLKKNNIVPDSICMESASKLKSNHATVILLINSGGVVNEKCLKSYLEHVRDPQLDALVEAYIKNTKKNEIET